MLPTHHSPSHPCVITGLGVISPIGNTLDTFRDSLFVGRHGIKPRAFPFRGTMVEFPVAAVDDFESSLIDPKRLGLMDRVAQLAVVSATQALKDAGISQEETDPKRIAVIIGTGVGGHNTLEESYVRLLTTDALRVHPFTIPKLMVNAGASQISMNLGLRGVTFTVASACASALHAMGVARLVLESGLADYVVTGGAESCLTFGTLKGWEALRVMAPDVPRPFSQGRAGMVIGEGAGMMVLERESHAHARNARCYARLAGLAMNADARDLTAPNVMSAAEAIEAALVDARIDAKSIDMVNAHGTGTRLNDMVEAQALHHALGSEVAQRVPVTANKGHFGHALGAASALEMIAAITSLTENKVPPTLGWLGADPECALNVVTGEAHAQKVDTVLKTAFAFGGLNAVAVIRKV